MIRRTALAAVAGLVGVSPLSAAPKAPVAAPAPAPPLVNSAQAKLPYDISADHQELFNDENKTIYSGNVEVLQGTDRLRTPRLTIFFAKKDPNAKVKAAPTAAGGAGDSFGKIDHMEAEGPVFFSNPTQNGRGDHGVYTAADQTTVLTGNVVLVQGKNVSTGDKLVLHQDTNQAQLYSGQSSQRVRGVFYQDDQTPPAGAAPAAPAAPKPPKPSKRH